MPGWVEDLLKEMFYGPFYQLAKVVWDWCIGLSTGVISQDPQHQLKRKYHVGTVYRRDDPAGGLKCVDADGNAVDEDPVFHGIPDGRNGIGFPGTRFFHRRSGCRKCSVLVVYGIPIFLYRTDLWNADLFNFI